MEYSYINPGDDEINLKMNFSVMELKVIHNVILTMLDDNPEMLTYQNVVNKIYDNLNSDCVHCDYFYGVNDFNDIQMMDIDDSYGLAVDINVQSTTQSDDEDMVLFFSPEQIELMAKANKKMKKVWNDCNK